MNLAFIARWTRMPHSIGRLSASVSSHPSLSSAAFITNIAESDFRYAQPFLKRNDADLFFRIVVRPPVQEHNTAYPFGLLRPRRERPRDRCAADERDELAASHCQCLPCLEAKG